VKNLLNLVLNAFLGQLPHCSKLRSRRCRQR